MRSLLHIAVLAIGCAAPLHADTQSVPPEELRDFQTTEGGLNLKQAMIAVASKLDGQPVDARAFQADRIYYRILVKTSEGRLVSVILDAQSGKQVSSKSRAGQEIALAAANSSELSIGPTEDLQAEWPGAKHYNQGNSSIVAEMEGNGKN